MSLRHDGIRLLNFRINHLDGRAPERTEGATSRWETHGTSPYWTVIRHSAKGEVWARSTHGAARVSHQIKYQLVATHRLTGETVKITVWKCSRRAHSEIKVGRRPLRLAERCWLCSKV